jgi:hypothetical protein
VLPAKRLNRVLRARLELGAHEAAPHRSNGRLPGKNKDWIRSPPLAWKRASKATAAQGALFADRFSSRISLMSVERLENPS